MLTAQWKHLRRGRNGRYRSGRFRDSAMRHLGVNSASYFYQIIGGKVEIPDVDIEVLIELVNNVKNIR